MTLFKQIALSVSLFLMIILSTVVFLNFKSSQSFIQDQLYSSAEDTAASLALSLGGVVDSESDTTAEMDTMISAIFDRGYYEAITLFTPDKKIIIQKAQRVVVKNVPQWFIEFATLNTKAATSEVSGGWTPFGVIEVKNHPGHAYVQLWDIFIDLMETFSILGVLFLTILGILIHIILRSLRDIEHQAKAIQDNDFIIYEKVPFTTEFRHVVTAMNSMVGKVKQIFDKEAESLKKYHELLYTDTATKLFNRRYLMMRLASYLEAESQNDNGSFVLISFDDMEEAKSKLGYVKLETLSATIAHQIQDYTAGYEDGIAARMNNSDFALLLPQAKLDKIKDSLTKMVEGIAKSIADMGVSQELVLSGGAINYADDDTQKTLFSRADFELAKTKMRRDNSVAFCEQDSTQKLSLGKEEWIEMISSSMEDNMLKVASQKVVDCHNRENVLHEEVYLRMIDDKGNIYNAGYFMPVLMNLKLTDDVDRHVVSLALYHTKNNLIQEGVAINITAGFLKNPVNFHWLEKEISLFSKTSKKQLSFEASKFSVIKNVELFSDFSMLLKQYGYHFGIDNFTIGAEGLKFLQQIKPSYIKASQSFFLDLQADNDSTMSDSLSILAKSIGIKLIATAVEHESDIDKLMRAGIEYMQGQAINEPKLLGA